MIEIIKAEHSDYTTIRDRARENMIHHLLPITGRWIEKEFNECFHSRENYLIIYNNETIGHLGIKSYKKSLSLKDIQIDSRHQSKGIGKMCLNWIETIALKNAHEFIQLSVFKRNKRAIEFYKANGYIELKEHEYRYDLIKNL